MRDQRPTILPCVSPSLEAETGCERRGWRRCWRKCSSPHLLGTFLYLPPPSAWHRTPGEEVSILWEEPLSPPRSHAADAASHLVQKVQSGHVGLFCLQELAGDLKQLLLIRLLEKTREDVLGAGASMNKRGRNEFLSLETLEEQHIAFLRRSSVF